MSYNWFNLVLLYVIVYIDILRADCTIWWRVANGLWAHISNKKKGEKQLWDLAQGEKLGFTEKVKKEIITVLIVF